MATNICRSGKQPNFFSSFPLRLYCHQHNKRAAEAGDRTRGIAMEKATLKQAKRILEIFEDTPPEQIQAILGSGLLADLRDGNIAQVNRALFRNFLGFNPDTEIILKGDQPPIGKFFKTVTLGIYKSFQQIERAIWDSGKKIGIRKDLHNHGEEMLRAISISRIIKGVNIYEVTGADLGFTSLASRKEIFKRSFEFGFEKCSAEIGPYVFIKCTDGKRRLVGMDPFTDKGINIQDAMFYLYGECDKIHLSSFFVCDNYKWLPDFAWLFIWPRQKSE